MSAPSFEQASYAGIEPKRTSLPPFVTDILKKLQPYWIWYAHIHQDTPRGMVISLHVALRRIVALFTSLLWKVRTALGQKRIVSLKKSDIDQPDSPADSWRRVRNSNCLVLLRPFVTRRALVCFFVFTTESYSFIVMLFANIRRRS